jgi:hypothetical protein
MNKIRAALAAAYRFKPLRTASQALAPLIGTTMLGVDWRIAIGTAAAAGLVSLLQITAEGGDLFADDARVTGTKATAAGS